MSFEDEQYFIDKPNGLPYTKPHKVQGMCPAMGCIYQGVVYLSDDIPNDKKVAGQIVAHAGKVLMRGLTKAHDDGEHEPTNALNTEEEE